MKLEVFVDAEKQATFEWANKWILSTQDASISNWWQKQNAALSFFDGLATIFSWESIGYDVLIVDWKDWEKFKDEFERREESIIKSKIYLKPQERPPKGLEVKRGPKGGLYYETKVKVEPLKPKEIRVLGLESKYEKDAKKLFEDDKDFFDDYDYYPKEKIYKSDFDKQLLTELENWSSFIENTDKKHLIKLFEDYQKGVLSPEEHQSLSRIIIINQKLLEYEVGETITVYRGVKKKHFPTIDKHGKITSQDLSSWSLNADTAKKFVYGLIHDGNDAILLKTKIPVKSIGITYLSGWSEFPEEQEIMILPNTKMDVKKIRGME